MTDQLHRAAFQVAAAAMKVVGPRVAGRDRPRVARLVYAAARRAIAGHEARRGRPGRLRKGGADGE